MNNLIYALKDDKLTHISRVQSGLLCGCFCPSCGEELVAKKGNEKMHHFAHRSGTECQYGYQTSIHIAAKEIIGRSKSFWLPAVYVEFDSHKQKQLVKSAAPIKIDGAELEKNMGGIIPDILLTSGGKQLAVEIFVTHAVDAGKLEKFKDRGISCLEIDLRRKELTDLELRRALLSDSGCKHWRYNAVAEKLKNKFMSACEKKKVSNGRVKNCPKKGKADLFDDCTLCAFNISQEEDSIYCSGASGISKIEDII